MWKARLITKSVLFPSLEFNIARGYSIERENYIQHLKDGLVILIVAFNLVITYVCRCPHIPRVARSQPSHVPMDRQETHSTMYEGVAIMMLLLLFLATSFHRAAARVDDYCTYRHYSRLPLREEWYWCHNTHPLYHTRYVYQPIPYNKDSIHHHHRHHHRHKPYEHGRLRSHNHWRGN